MIAPHLLENFYWLTYSSHNPSLRELLLHIFVTDFCRSLEPAAPSRLAHLLLPDRKLAANASVFLARWRSDLSHFATYNALAQAMARELDVTSLIAGLSAEQLAECMTFEDVELRVVQDLKQRILLALARTWMWCMG